jgi:hypothetical protein
MLSSDTAPPGAPHFPACMFRWREGAQYAWHEEVCPDNWQYARCDKTVQFSYAQPGDYYLEVEADHLGQVAETNEANNSFGWTLSIAAAEPSTSTPVPTSQPSIEFWAEPQYIDAGQCTTLGWSVSGVREVYLDNQGQVGEGSRQACPCRDTTYTLRVVHTDGSTTEHLIIVYVNGSCEQPVEPPPPPPAGSEPPPPQDTSGPEVTDVNVEFRSEPSCRFFGRARVTDPSGVGWAQFYFRLDGGDWRSVWMGDRGNGYFEAEAGIEIMMTTGYLEYYVIAADALGNGNESSVRSANYWMCGGG